MTFSAYWHRHSLGHSGFRYRCHRRSVQAFALACCEPEGTGQTSGGGLRYKLESQKHKRSDAKTEQEWLACTDPAKMVELLRGKASDRKLRLLACACCRQVWHLLRNEKSRNAIEVAERFADGNATDAELVAAHYAARALFGARSFCGEGFPDGEEWAVDAAADAAHVVSKTIGSVICNAAWAAIADTEGDYGEDSDAQVALIGDIFGNPFRPVTVDPAWLAWNDRTVQKLAQAIYDDRAFDRMAILGDALEECGCNHADMLNHCRQPGEHVRGCWVVDLLLGKE